MAPQLQLNQGPQDALLFDNDNSYFNNVGYVRTSNFQMELRDIDPQNTATLGSKVEFIIPKAADILGPTDLLVEFTQNEVDMFPSDMSAGTSAHVAWVEALGYAMLDKATLEIGSHMIEEITGEQLYIQNELMRSDEKRFGSRLMLKTGRPLLSAAPNGTSYNPDFIGDVRDRNNGSRLISYAVQNSTGAGTTTDPTVAADIKGNPAGKKLIVPLCLFFTKHPSSYFPLNAIAGCNDFRISVKFRSRNELMQIHTSRTVDSGALTDVAATAIPNLPKVDISQGTCKLRCYYVHVTGTEAARMMDAEHVRLIKVWRNHNTTVSIPHELFSATAPPRIKRRLFDMELPFLHPTQELIVIIRKASEMSNSIEHTATPSDFNQQARTKNYFAFQGGGRDPNIESIKNMTDSGADVASEAYLQVEDFKVTLNGQERHPSLARSGLDRDYIMNLGGSTYIHIYMHIYEVLTRRIVFYCRVWCREGRAHGEHGKSPDEGGKKVGRRGE